MAWLALAGDEALFKGEVIYGPGGRTDGVGEAVSPIRSGVAWHR
ncbi:MAG TPA: hypothetical protein VG795_09370 [Acidimicrobiia bacterium]|nr:hypothetical protein [Acidimicrobiia bacterium]